MKDLIRQKFKIKKRHPATAWGLAILWILLISFLAFFWNLGNTGLIDETEPLFAEASRQMTVTGDWITPYFNTVTRFDKPALIYWCQGIAYKIFGVNEFATRLPSALAGLALTSITFYTLKYFGNLSGDRRAKNQDASLINAPEWQSWLVACLGSAMVALHPLTLFFGRTGYSDMLLSICIGGALLSFFLAYAQPEFPKIQEGWYLAFYVLMALAVLTKGPVGIVLPGFIIISFLLYVGKFKEVLGEMRLIRGAIIFLLISVPWFVLVILRNGDAYINSFFGVHNFERFTSVVNAHQGPWYFHILVVLLGFAPWSIGLPSAIANINVFQRRYWQQSPRQFHLGLFALFWFVTVLTFFTIAVTKYFSYTLPLMPAAAILLALWWGEQITVGQIFQQQNRSLKLTSIAIIVFFIALAGACYYSPNWLGNNADMPKLGFRLSQAGLSNFGAIIWGLSAIAGIILLLLRQVHWLWEVKFLGFVAFLMFVIMPASFILDAERQLPLRQIAQSIIQVRTPDEEVIMIPQTFEKPSLVFYTKRPVTFLRNSSEAIPRIQKKTKRFNFKSVLLIGSNKSLKEAGLKPKQYKLITQAGIYQLVRVPKAGVR
jgi:4-amino-4-deoxy-L-arabinose transferase-like glycosyltransferase